jgi:ABC-type transporter Mla subunit MlaD
MTAVSAISDTEQMTSVLDGFFEMVDSPVSVKALEDFGKSFETLKKKQADGLSTDELVKYRDEVKTALAGIEEEFFKMAELQGITPEVNPQAYNQLQAVFEGLRPQIDTLSVSAQELSTSLGISLEEAMIRQAEAASMVEGGMLDTGDATEQATVKVYELTTAIDMLSGVTEEQIADTEEMIWMIERQASILAGLTEGTDEYALAEANLNATKEQLIALYPHLFNYDATALSLTSDKIAAIAAEIDANDVLRAAYAASRDGKLTSEQEATIANLENTNNRIKNINAEIAALNKLAQAYAAMAADVRKKASEMAVDAGKYMDENEFTNMMTRSAELSRAAQNVVVLSFLSCSLFRVC